jgi:hypothetical protein
MLFDSLYEINLDIDIINSVNYVLNSSLFRQVHVIG